jgi:hypothetical protein
LQIFKWIPYKENDTIHVIASIEHLFFWRRTRA